MFDENLLLALRNMQNPQMFTDAQNVSSQNQDDTGEDEESQEPEQGTAGIDVPGRLAELYTPSTVATDAFRTHLNAMPQREDYQRGAMGKIGAALAGFGAGVSPVGIDHGTVIGMKSNPGAAFATTSGILEHPYDLAMGDWSNKAKELSLAANEEQKSNNLQRQVAEQTISREIQNRREDTNKQRVDEQARANKTKEDQKNESLRIQQQRADAYSFSKTHPNYKGWVDKTGKLVYVNQSDPNDIVHTDIDTGKLNDFDKINLNIRGRIDEINAQGQNQQNLENAKQGNRVINENTRQQNRLQLRNTPAPGKSTTTTTEISPKGDKKIVTQEVKPKIGDNSIEQVPADPAKRTIGKIYILGNGRKGQWNGSSFVLQKE